MNFIDVDQFVRDQLNELANGQLDAVLGRVSQMAHDVSSHPRALSKVLASPELDELCRVAGQSTLAQLNHTPANLAEKPWLFIATYLYDNGGHTRVLEDFIKFADGKKCIVLLTNLANGDPVIHKGDLYVDEVARLGADTEICLGGGLADKLRWLQQKIVDLQPERTFLFHHFYDSVAIAACEAIPPGSGYLLHHADYRFSLGVHTACLNHIDFHAAGLCACRDKIKVKNQVYWPMSASDDGIRSAESFYKNGRFTTASSGAPAKFNVPYPYNYFDLIGRMVHATDGAHVHIGRLSDDDLARIYRGLDAHGMPHERLIYVPVVPSVWRALVEFGVDVYLPSFPTGGNKATIEAMGCGTPIISHQGLGDFRYILGGDFIMYPQTPRWREPEQLLNALRSMNQLPELLKHRLAARAQYDAQHAESVARHAINTREAMPLPDIALETFTPMSLQDFYFYEAYPMAGA